MALSTFTVLCNHHHHPCPEQIIFPVWTPSPLNTVPSLSCPQAWQLPLYSLTLCTSHKWNQMGLSSFVHVSCVEWKESGDCSQETDIPKPGWGGPYVLQMLEPLWQHCPMGIHLAVLLCGAITMVGGWVNREDGRHLQVSVRRVGGHGR